MKGFITTQYFKTSLGELILGSFNNKLCLCDWRYRKNRSHIDTRVRNGLKAQYEVGESEVLKNAVFQLTEYFEGKRTVFDLPLLFIGTSFQKAVWNELLKVPYGKTVSYIRISQNLGNTKAIRAIASANGANSLAIIVPCHRIIGNNGKLVGYAGGLDVKKRLLQLENAKQTSAQMELFI